MCVCVCVCVCVREALTLLLDTFHNEAESFLLSEVTHTPVRRFFTVF